MRKAILLLFAILVPPAFAGGITAGFVTGWNPDILHFNTAIATTQTALSNCIKGSNTSCNSSDRTSSLTSRSAQASGIPLGLNIRYLEQYYMLRLGFHYQFSVGGKNEMTVQYTDGRTQNVSEDYDMRTIQIPLTVAFNLRHDAFTRLYAGLGPSLYYGSARIIHDNGKTTTDSSGNTVALLPDEDLFQGWAFGAHALIGSEVSLTSDMSLSLEVWFTYGTLGAVEDSAVTKQGSKNVQNQENDKNPEILGIYSTGADSKYIQFDPGMPDGLNFTGVQILVSFNYFIGIL